MPKRPRRACSATPVLLPCRPATKRQHPVSPTTALTHGAHLVVAQRAVLGRLGLVPECQCRQGYVTLQAYCAQDGLIGVMFARLGVELRVRGNVGGVDGHCDDDGWYVACAYLLPHWYAQKPTRTLATICSTAYVSQRVRIYIEYCVRSKRKSS